MLTLKMRISYAIINKILVVSITNLWLIIYLSKMKKKEPNAQVVETFFFFFKVTIPICFMFLKFEKKIKLVLSDFYF